MVREHALYPEQRVQAAAARGAYQKRRGRPAGVRLGRIGDAAKGNARKIGVDFLQLRLGPVVVVADGHAYGDDRSDDEDGEPSTLEEGGGEDEKQNARTYEEPRRRPRGRPSRSCL